MARRPALRMRLAPSFPARIQNSDGIGVARSGGAVTIRQDWSGIQRDATPDDPENYDFLLGKEDGSLVRLSATELGALRPIASLPEAEAGVDNNTTMTPLRTSQQIDARLADHAVAAGGADNSAIMTPLGVNQYVSAQLSDQPTAEAGSNNTKTMTPLRTKQSIVANAEGANFTPALPATYTRPIGDKLKEARSILEWINPSKHAAIRSATLSGDLNDELDAVAASGERRIRVPRGSYPVALDGWTWVASTNGFNLAGEDARDSVFDNVQVIPVPARPMVVFSGLDQRVADVNFKVNTGTMLQPTMGGGQIAFGSGVLFMGSRFICERVQASDTWDNGLASGSYDLSTGAQTDGSPADGLFYACFTQRAGSGTQTMTPAPGGPIPSAQPFNAGAGINNLTGGRIRIIACRDEYSTQNFVSDYAGGAHDVWVGCTGYGARKSRVGSYANLDVTPGGQGFYLGSSSKIVGCAIYDPEGDGLWADAHSKFCDIDLLVKGGKQRSALIQGRDQVAKIRSQDASQRGAGLYDAVEVKGAAAVGIDTFGPSSGIIVHAHTTGSMHRYGLSVNESSYQAFGALAAGAYLNGATGPINVPSVERFSVGAFTQPGVTGMFRRGLNFFSRSNHSYLTEPFGDTQGNGHLLLADASNPDKRLALGYDPVNDLAVIQAMHAGIAKKTMGLNPSGGDVLVGLGSWNTGCLRLGGYYLWIDSSGRLRIKSSAPGSDTDGTVVGAQT